MSLDEREGETVNAQVEHRSAAGDDLDVLAEVDGAVDVEIDGLVSYDDALPTGAVVVPRTAGHRHARADGSPHSRTQLRSDFGAHFEANYQRLVAQLYAITLDPGEAHDVIQDAYSRAWRNWSEISSSADPTAWVRRVAVRSTIRSWRRVLAGLGVGRRRAIGGAVDPRTAALLTALRRLPAAERRCVVLFHMAGSSLGEIAAVERVSPETVHARLFRGQQVVAEGMAEDLAVWGLPLEEPAGAYQYGADQYGADQYGNDPYGDDPYGDDPYGDQEDYR